MANKSRWGLGIASVLASVVLSWVMIEQGQAGYLDALGYVTGVIWVWLAAAATIWNFPVGLLNAALMSFVLYRANLYADAALYAYFFVMMGFGWYWWSRKGPEEDVRPVRRAPMPEVVGVVVAGGAVFFGVYQFLKTQQGTIPLWDSLGFTVSFIAQYWQSRKYIECWPGWVVANCIYIPIYLVKQLPLFSVFSAILLGLAIQGWITWKQEMAKRTAA